MAAIFTHPRAETVNPAALPRNSPLSLPRLPIVQIETTFGGRLADSAAIAP
jgi:hypothetical protein